MRNVVAVRHVAFEDLGTLGDLARDHGLDVRYVDAGLDPLPRGAAEPDLLVVLGGPIGAYDERAYPFVGDELRCVRERIESGRPLLGICLGAQLIARALGARVYPGPAKEIGWSRVSLTAEGRDSCLAPLAAEESAVLHWHGDTFDLPAGAALLASTARYERQAFRLGAILGLQFHVEVRAVEFERWLVGHAAEIAATPGVSVQALRGDAARHGRDLEGAARLVFGRWLNEVGL